MGATQIRPGLFLGSQADARDELFLSANNISALLNLREVQVGISPYISEARHIPMGNDGETDLAGVLSKALPFFDYIFGAGQSLLVHCALGQNRSASVVAGYLILREGLGAQASVCELVRLRPVVSISDQYLRQLYSLELSCK